MDTMKRWNRPPTGTPTSEAQLPRAIRLEHLILDTICEHSLPIRLGTVAAGLWYRSTHELPSTTTVISIVHLSQTGLRT